MTKTSYNIKAGPAVVLALGVSLIEVVFACASVLNPNIFNSGSFNSFGKFDIAYPLTAISAGIGITLGITRKSLLGWIAAGIGIAAFLLLNPHT